MLENLKESSGYLRKVIQGNDFFEVVSCEWGRGSFSPAHQHGWSQCMVMVEQGCFENHLDFGTRKEVSIVEQGQVIVTPIGAKHEIRCLSEVGKTFHVYVPRIKETEKSSFRTPTRGEIHQHLDLHLQEGSLRWDLLQNLIGEIKEKSISTSSPFFMNQLFSGVTAESIVAEELITHGKTTMATFEASPIFTTIEIEVIEKLADLIGWSKQSREGITVPGGSAANLMALHCARQRRFPEWKKSGSRGEKVKIFVSQEAHYSFKKAVVALGLGTESLVTIPADAQGRLKPESLEIALREALSRGEIPLMVVATAGTTVLGAFDPIEKMAMLCQAFDVWLHIDAAWGGPALFSKNTNHLFKGVEGADSLTFDAHKFFGAGLTCSFFLSRHPGLLLEANDVSGGDYIFHSDEPVLDRGRLSWQCGRKPDAVSLWTLWKSVGTVGLGRSLEKMFALRDSILPWIHSQSRLELVADPEYLNICLRIRSKEGAYVSAKKIRESLKEQNLSMINFSLDSKGDFLRLILAHPFLEARHLRQILEWAQEVC